MTAKFCGHCSINYDVITQKTLTTDVARVLRLIVKFRIMSCLIVT